MLKKVLSSILMIAILASYITLPTVSANETFQIGDYIIIGQYKNKPIVWRYVLDDENGKLLVSDKILCMKKLKIEYRDSLVECYLRKWLNSSEQVWWEERGNWYLQYDGELGFLSNFTQAQLSLMKTTTQWTMVASPRFSENGETHLFTLVKEKEQMGGHLGPGLPAVYYDLDDIPSIYYGAAMRTTDKVFLLDPMQVYKMKQNIGTTIALLDGLEEKRPYWLRSFVSSEANPHENPYDGLASLHDEYTSGVRPAIYLDESAIETMTGSGTKEDPYVLNERGGITVRLNGELLPSDQEPIIENGRTFVPFRAIFEALGAEVSWNGENQIATAKKEGLEIILQIGSNQMVVNGNVFFLDATPKIVHNRTLVPVRTVFENLQATVDWDEDLRQVIIITE